MSKVLLRASAMGGELLDYLTVAFAVFILLCYATGILV